MDFFIRLIPLSIKANVLLLLLSSYNHFLKLNKNNTKFKGAEKIQSLGFVIGLYTQEITKKELNFIKETLFSIDKI